MNLLDIKTVIILNFVTDLACTVLLFFTWYRNNKHFNGLLFWLLDLLLQTISIGLIFLRGTTPDWLSMVLSNTLVLTGAIFGYAGLQQFSGKPVKQTFNYVLVTLFLVVQYYFAVVRPDSEVRNYNVAIALLIITLQCSLFVLRKTEGIIRKSLTGVGVVFGIMTLLNVVRIIGLSRPNADPTSIDSYAFFLISYQILLIFLVYTMTLSVNVRLLLEVQTQEDKFSKTFYFSPSAIILTSLSDGEIIEVNKGFEKTLGYSRDEIKGKKTLDIDLWTREDDRQTFVKKLVHNKQINNEEVVFRKKNGENIVGLLSADLLVIDNSQLILSSLTDISYRKFEENKQKDLLEKVEHDRKALLSLLEDNKRAQDSLYESEARYRNLFEATNVAKSITYPDGSIYVNQAFCKWLGYSSEEMKNMNWREITPAEEHERIDAILKSLGRGGKTSTRFEKKYLHKDGSLRWGDISTAVQFDNKGETKYFITTVVDITEKKAAEEAVYRLNAELEKRVSDRTAQLEATNKELEAFSYSVSHDLRAPLRHITGYVDLLNERFGRDLPEQQRHYMHVISDSAKQMGTLIDDLLQFSRMGRKEIHLADLNMNSLIDEIITELSSDTAEREVVWTVGELPHVIADYAMIRQVWRNLMENAVKFTRKKSKAEIEIGSYAKDGHVIFHISDNGAGFDMKYAQKLFGVFQRMHNQSEFEGTGIGLANVQRIISKHDGRVWAESEPEKGSTFYFSLPVTN